MSTSRYTEYHKNTTDFDVSITEMNLTVQLSTLIVDEMTDLNASITETN